MPEVIDAQWQDSLIRLDHLVAGAAYLSEHWNPVLDAGYPTNLPSFEEFLDQLIAWRDTVKATVYPPRYRVVIPEPWEELASGLTHEEAQRWINQVQENVNYRDYDLQIEEMQRG